MRLSCHVLYALLPEFSVPVWTQFNRPWPDRGISEGSKLLSCPSFYVLSAGRLSGTEHSERLRAEVNTVKNSYRRNLVSYLSHPSSIHPFFYISNFLSTHCYIYLVFSSICCYIQFSHCYIPFISQSSFVILCYILLNFPFVHASQSIHPLMFLWLSG